MLLTEWNWDDCIAVRTEEAWEDGRNTEKYEIARKMKNAGRPIAEIEDFTGLSTEAVAAL